MVDYKTAKQFRKDVIPMSIREVTEQNEYKILSPYARKAAETVGRQDREEKCEVRTDFQRDRDRIIHSKAFRRLKHKTQVFLSPEGDHYRTRLTHTLEVSQIARTIARALRLNEDLTEAIALGHDLGHTPFGHCGEFKLDEIHPGGFKHNEQSLRVVDYIEHRKNHKKGLNLTAEVRDGIVNHSGPVEPFTLEGQIVKLCDRIAYINHDIDDAVRAGVLDLEVIPSRYIDLFGETHSKRINSMIMDVIHTSENSSKIRMSETKYSAMLELRKFMFDRVYLNPEAKKDESKAQRIVQVLYDFFCEHPEKMPSEYYEEYQVVQNNEPIKDYIAGMSDRYAVNRYKVLFLPKFWV